LSVYGAPTGALNQGDIRVNVPFIRRQEHGSEFVHVHGLVVSHSCDIDKFAELKHQLTGNEQKRFPILLAPLYNLASLDASAAGDARVGRHRRYFYIPPEAPHHEMVADLWFTQPVPLVVVQRLARAATLSDGHVAKLWAHSFVTMTRRDPKDVFIGGRLAP
jgi:hypothetical protein